MSFLQAQLSSVSFYFQPNFLINMESEQLLGLEYRYWFLTSTLNLSSHFCKNEIDCNTYPHFQFVNRAGLQNRNAHYIERKKERERCLQSINLTALPSGLIPQKLARKLSIVSQSFFLKITYGFKMVGNAKTECKIFHFAP